MPSPTADNRPLGALRGSLGAFSCGGSGDCRVTLRGFQPAGIVTLGSAAMRDYDDDDEKGFLWRLPKLRTKDWGKLGPAFGFGIGCGVGLGAGIVGGAGIGLGFPGLQFGFGLGAGCGVGVGFGYGLGQGKAYDENGTHSNVGRLPKRSGVKIAGSSGAEIGAILDDLASGVKRALDNIQSDNGKRKR